ncbi:hypothetical protein ccbrp13_56860 [Ktedonobacteria bacterium brp13]|nr:hypothetical protein ccbrp13_56860 [Ktedonobacteria bacterium brp13]
MQSSFCNLFPTDIRLEWNVERRVLSLLSTREPHIIAQQQFTKNEWLLLTNLIQSYPHYAPHEMLLAQLTLRSYDDWREQLQEIRRFHPDDIVRELKPVYRALSGVRTKLHRLYPQLKISLVRNTGYVFTLAPETSFQRK